MGLTDFECGVIRPRAGDEMVEAGFAVTVTFIGDRSARSYSSWDQHGPPGEGDFVATARLAGLAVLSLAAAEAHAAEVHVAEVVDAEPEPGGTVTAVADDCSESARDLTFSKAVHRLCEKVLRQRNIKWVGAADQEGRGVKAPH